MATDMNSSGPSHDCTKLSFRMMIWNSFASVARQVVRLQHQIFIEISVATLLDETAETWVSGGPVVVSICGIEQLPDFQFSEWTASLQTQLPLLLMVLSPGH